MRRKGALFTPVANLDTNYGFTINEDETVNISVDGNTIHHELKQQHDNLRLKYAQLYDSTNGKKNLTAVNIANTSIGVIYSDTSREEGVITELLFKRINIEVPYKPNKLVFGVHDFFNPQQNFHSTNAANKNSRNSSFNSMLQQHVDNCKEHCTHLAVEKNLIGKQRIDNIKALSNYSQFHETFHHSEQAFMHYISSEEGLTYTTKALMRYRPATVFGLVLDMYSTRYLCTNCNIGILGLQNSHEHGFLANFNSKLGRRRVDTLEDDLFLNTRVSATEACKGSTEYLPLFNIKNNKIINEISNKNRDIVLEADFNRLSVEDNPVVNTFASSYFLSRKLPDAKITKSKLSIS